MVRRAAEIAVLATGLSLLAIAGWRQIQRAAFQSQPRLAYALRPGLKILGKLEIPRLGLAAIVVEGADEKQLSVAVGHLAGTAAPGANGNVVLAGHRDAEFRALRSIRIGDRLRVTTDRNYIYVVSRIRIVAAEDVTPLADQSTPLLTLITCYPFRYVGDAPKRFIVQAELAGS